jgi:hypothetical protein
MKGSKYSILKLVESSDFIGEINKLLKTSGARITVYDNWMPKSIRLDREAELNDFLKYNFSQELSASITNWWLKVDATTPNWDLISTCSIEGVKGLLLIEAKAHFEELNHEEKGKQLDHNASENSKENHKKIGQAIDAANENLKTQVSEINISRDKCYQLSNRIAHAWWLANQGIPVVLVYLGFLNCKDMDYGNRILFKTDEEWQEYFRNHAQLVGADELIEKWVDCWRSKFMLISRSY